MRRFLAYAPLFVCGLSPCLAFPMAEIEAESAIMVAQDTGRVLWEKDAYSRRFPASTTKIMTALLFIENVSMDAVVTAPRDVDQVSGSSLHLKPFERVPAEDLLYSLLLRSANDAAYAVAVHVAGSEQGFARMMNERARQLGCTSTNFVNPHGLHHPSHYSTAHDLAVIAREAMKNETFAKVARSEYRFIERSMNDEDILLRSHNKFLKGREDATGIKTGWTIPAGRCFVGSAERDGLRVITVVLKSKDWKGDSDILADWAFEHWTAEPVIARDQVLVNYAVSGGDRVSVPLAAAEEYATVRPRDGIADYTVTGTSVSLDLPVRAGERVGVVTFRDQDGVEHEMPVYAATDVERARFALGGDPASTTFVLIVVAFVGGAWYIRRRAVRL